MFKFFHLLIFLFFVFPKIVLPNQCEILLDMVSQYNLENKFDPSNLMNSIISKQDTKEMEAWGIVFRDYYDEDSEEVLFSRFEKNNYLKIDKVHPNLNFILKWFDAEISKSEYTILSPNGTYIDMEYLVKEINGKNVGDLKDEQIKSEMKKFSSIKFFNSDNEEKLLNIKMISDTLKDLKRLEALEFIYTNEVLPVSVTMRSKNIQEINSKQSNSESVVELVSAFERNHIANFIEKKTDLDFIECITTTKNAEEYGILTQLFQPTNFIPTIDTLTTVGIYYSSKKANDNLEVDYDELGLDKTGTASLSIETKSIFTGKFKHDLGLKKFPFDIQDLNFEFELVDKYYSYFLDLNFSEDQNYKLYVDSINLILPEWRVGDTMKFFGTELDPDFDLRIPYIGFYVETIRNSQYFLYKVLLPILIILSISWSVFWIKPNELESRITISIVCMLSLIAYNFVIDENLPKIGYLTLIDWFIISAYIFSAFPTIETVITNNLFKNNKKSFALIIDKRSRYLVPTIFLITNFSAYFLFLHL